MSRKQESIFKGQVSTAVDFNEMAKKVLEEVPLYFDESKIWFRWNQKKYCWEKVDETDILISIQAELDVANVSQGGIRNDLINALQVEARKSRPVDLKPTEIQFKDTIIDIETGEKKAADSSFFSFNTIPWELGEIEDTPVIDEYLKSWVGEDRLKIIQEWMAYNMLCAYPVHRVACFNGSGSNGKSTLIRLMCKACGNNNIAAGELDTVFLQRFGLTCLFRKTGIVMGEANFDTLTKTGRFKAATGEDKLSIEFKGKNNFDYNNYAKVTICTNSLPVTEDKTDGFYRRWLIIHFPNKFKEKYDVLKQIPDTEYKNFCRKAIRLLKEVIERGSFTGEGDVESRREEYEKISNPLQVFLAEAIKQDPESFLYKREFSTKFREWQRVKGYRILTDVEIGKYMKNDYEVAFRTSNDGNTKERAWLGIRWKED